MSKYGPRIKKMFVKFFDDNCMNYAAASTFFMLICFLPSLMIFMNIIKLFPVQIGEFMAILKANLPSQIYSILDSIVSDLYGRRAITMTLTIIFAVYSAGQGFMTIMSELDNIMKIKSKRTWIIRRLKSTIYMFILMLIFIFIIAMYIYGGKIVDKIEPFYPTIADIFRHIIIRKVIILPLVLLFTFTWIYIYVPSQKGKFFEMLPGGVVATIGALLFTAIFSTIVKYSSNFNYMYGSLANAIYTLFWIYAIFIILFVGAEFNMYIKYGWIVLPKWMRISQRPFVKKVENILDTDLTFGTKKEKLKDKEKPKEK